jgi:hypothetical protein
MVVWGEIFQNSKIEIMEDGRWKMEELVRLKAGKINPSRQLPFALHMTYNKRTRGRTLGRCDSITSNHPTNIYNTVKLHYAHHSSVQ